MGYYGALCTLCNALMLQPKVGFEGFSEIYRDITVKSPSSTALVCWIIGKLVCHLIAVDANM